MQVTPELNTQFTVGNTNIFVVEVDEDADQYAGSGQGRTRITGHDDEGNEVEILMFTVTPEQFRDEMGYEQVEAGW